MFKQLDFFPLFGLSSKHLQTTLGAFRSIGEHPPSETMRVALGNGDFLTCEISRPAHFEKIVVLVHGLGGSHASGYMVRLAKRLYDKGIMAVRLNLRGCGSGAGLSSLPYHAGRSQDVLLALQALQKYNKELYLVGFSLGANIVLKLAGEMGDRAIVRKTIAICPPVDLAESVQLIQKKSNYIYHTYYLKKVCEQARIWRNEPVRTLFEFDDKVTGPLWGFSGAEEYYKSSSSIHYLPHIRHECHLLFAEDDPFVNIKNLINAPVEVWTTKKGGHMGFIGHTEKEYRSFWLDQQLIHWIN
jgi:predicted alpha/beta-fold hydrolase